MSKENIKSEIEKSADVSSQEGKVGTMLYDVRTKKKISIEEVASALYIKPAYLDAIEKSDYASIPEPPYGIGFIRSYANYLGLNSSRIVQIFKEETETTEPVTESHNVFAPAEESEVNTPNRKYLIISLIMLIVVYALWMILSSSDNDTAVTYDEKSAFTTDAQTEEYPLQVENFATETESALDESQLDSQQITVTDESFNEKETTAADTKAPKAEHNTNQATQSAAADSAKVETSVSQVKTTPDKTPNKGRVVLKVKKETWVEVKDENKLWLSKVLHAGSEYALPDNGEGKTVSFGNTDGVDVIIDGKVVSIISPNKKTNIKMDAFLTRNH